MNPFEKLQLSKVVNAAGKMTYLGSSAVTPSVAALMAEAAQCYVDMASLKQAVNQKASELAGVEAACVTSCAAAGIAISVAAALTGTDLDQIESLPEVKGTKREVILQKGHAVNFGANLAQMIRMTGATVKEIGTVNGVKPYHLEGAITEATAAIVHVVSHHAVSNEMLTLIEVTEIARRFGIPVIVDAAAEVDLRMYLNLGADLAIYSGHKAIGGPTSGLILGRRPLVEACRLQEKGFARAMKIGKENIIGLYASLEQYVNESQEEMTTRYEKIITSLEKELAQIPSVQAKVTWDATRPIPRLQVLVLPSAGIMAKPLIAKLEAHSPSIRTRNHLADQGIIQFDPRELKLEETALIAQAIEQFTSVTQG